MVEFSSHRLENSNPGPSKSSLAIYEERDNSLEAEATSEAGCESWKADWPVVGCRSGLSR